MQGKESGQLLYNALFCNAIAYRPRVKCANYSVYINRLGNFYGGFCESTL